MVSYFMVFGIGLFVLLFAGIWKVYEKAGFPGWNAFIPIYNLIVMLKIVGKPTWWIVLLFIPGINIVLGIIMLNSLAQSFEKDIGFTIGLIIFPFLFYPILGFSDAAYVGPEGGGYYDEDDEELDMDEA